MKLGFYAVLIGWGVTSYGKGTEKTNISSKREEPQPMRHGIGQCMNKENCDRREKYSVYRK